MKGSTETFNELRFEDKKGEEQIYFHAEKDFERVVENDDTLKVGFDTKDPGSQTIDIFQDRTTTLDKGNDKLQIKEGNRDLIIDKGNLKLQVAKGNRELLVDTGTDTISIKGDRSVTISEGGHTLTLDKGDQTVSISMGNQTIEVPMGKSSTEAMQSIELKVGSNSLKIDMVGITIKGTMVKIEGTAMAEMKSPLTTVKGDGVVKVDSSGLLMVKGAILKFG
jgi:type VI secretion system secreted protein VgrG